MERAPYVCESRGRSTGHRGAEHSATQRTAVVLRTVEKFESHGPEAVSGRWLLPDVLTYHVPAQQLQTH